MFTALELDYQTRCGGVTPRTGFSVDLHLFRWTQWLLSQSIRYAPAKLPQRGYIGTVTVPMPSLDALFPYEALLDAAPQLRVYDLAQWDSNDPDSFPSAQTMERVRAHVTYHLRAFLPHLLHLEVFDRVEADNTHGMYAALFLTELTAAVCLRLPELGLQPTDTPSQAAAVDHALRLYRRDGSILSSYFAQHPTPPTDEFPVRVKRYYLLTTLATL